MNKQVTLDAVNYPDPERDYVRIARDPELICFGLVHFPQGYTFRDITLIKPGQILIATFSHDVDYTKKKKGRIQTPPLEVYSVGDRVQGLALIYSKIHEWDPSFTGTFEETIWFRQNPREGESHFSIRSGERMIPVPDVEYSPTNELVDKRALRFPIVDLIRHYNMVR